EVLEDLRLGRGTNGPGPGGRRPTAGRARCHRGFGTEGMNTTRVALLWHSMKALSGVTTCLELLGRHLPQFGVEPTVIQLEPWEGTDDRTVVPRPAGPGSRAAPPRAGAVVDAGRRIWHTAHGYHRQVIRKINRCRPHLAVCNDQRGWN